MWNIDLQRYLKIPLSPIKLTINSLALAIPRHVDSTLLTEILFITSLIEINLESVSTSILSSLPII